MRPSASKVRTLLLALLSLAAPAAAIGQGSVTQIKVTNTYDANPGATIYIGDNVAYEAVLDKKSDIVTHVKWEYQWVNCSVPSFFPVTTWIDSDGESAVDFSSQEGLCGRKTVWVTVTFRDYWTGLTHDSSASTSVGVQPPTACVLAPPPNGVGVPTHYLPYKASGNLAVTFLVQGGSRTLYFENTVYEAIARGEFPNTQSPPLDSRAWGPADDISFSAPGVITDFKGVNDDETGKGWAALTLGNNPPIDEFNQIIGVNVPLGCGGSRQVRLGTFHFQQVKINATQWQLVVI